MTQQPTDLDQIPYDTTYDEATPSVFLISGIMAAGKSTVAQALAERLPTSVHLRGDVFRRMIVRGQAEMTATLSNEAERQLQLRYQLAVTAAQLYLGAGFTVVYQDIVVGEALPQVAAALSARVPNARAPNSPLYVVVLCPRAEAAAARDATRSKTGYSDGFSAATFDQALRRETPRLGFWLDTTALGVEATVDAILENVAQARVH